ncbi:hypothetical protein E0F89_00810 [Flavobacterium caseinilyticum]|uniref:Uncharacterized protein n=2 Tax=Flavobacterium caseinilyticum TaxID=2541732 RepID=A0A4R5B3Q9_9FLAO|nr:hypothetical protein E0F89_00810 [Flavobacterium caseinilyticum]
MSTNVPNNQDDREIDLMQISRNIGDFFRGINSFFFQCIQFFFKNGIVIMILFIVGVGVGVYLDKTKKTYDHQIIVSPNFGSTDYLYSKIDLISAKIKEGDTVFLKNIVGIKKPKEIIKIEIKPIADVYKFIDNKAENFELIKLMAEDGDVKKILEDNLTSKNYTSHTVFFKTNRLTYDKETVQPLLDFLNDSEYYRKIQQVVLKNLQIKMTENDSIISQINGVLNGFSNRVNGSQTSNKLIYFNENTQLNEVIKTKDVLINEQGKHRIDSVGYDKIVKDNSAITNIENTSSVNGKLKFIIPLLLIFGFILIKLFQRFYNKQKKLSLQST